MEPRMFSGRVLRRWLLTGATVGFAWTVVDCLVWFGVPAIRQPAEELLGRLVGPLHGHLAGPIFVALPAGVMGLFLVGWVPAFMGRKAMEPEITAPVLRNWLRAGVKFGFAWVLFNNFVFFWMEPIRESTLPLLGLSMEPLLFAVPLGVTAVFLAGWLLSFLWKGNPPKSQSQMH